MVDRPLVVDQFYVEVVLEITKHKTNSMDIGSASGMARCAMENWATVPVIRASYYRYLPAPPTIRATKRLIPAPYSLLSLRYGRTVALTPTNAARGIAKAAEYKILKAA